MTYLQRVKAILNQMTEISKECLPRAASDSSQYKKGLHWVPDKQTSERLGSISKRILLAKQSTSIKL